MFKSCCLGCGGRARGHAAAYEHVTKSRLEAVCDMNEERLHPVVEKWAIPRAYTDLHELGWAHSIEVYDRDDGLVGGLYGVRIDRLFAGESMFHRVDDASKVALVHTVEWLVATGATLFDVQWTTPHLASLGAVDVARSEYLERLAEAVTRRSDA